MKQIGGDKGALLLAVRTGAVDPLLAHVSRTMLTWVMLFSNGGGALLAQNREKLQGDHLNLHFSRENFEGLEQTREYLSHNMMVMIFMCSNIISNSYVYFPFLSWIWNLHSFKMLILSISAPFPRVQFGFRGQIQTFV